MAALCLAPAPLLAAASLIPGLEYLQLSTRAAIAFGEAGAGFTPYELIQLALPQVGVPVPALYLGVVPLGLALAAAARPTGQAAELRPAERAGARFWALLGLAALLLSFGALLPPYHLFYHLAPGWRLFRHQERVIVWTVFAVALLAGYGAAWARREWARGGAGGWLRTASVAYSLAAVAALALGLGFFVEERAGKPELWGFVAASLFLAALLAGAAIALRKRSTFLLLLVLAFDLFTLNRGNHAGPYNPDPFPPSGMLAVPRADPDPVRTANEDGTASNYGMLYGLEELGGASPLSLGRYQAFLENVPVKRAWQLLNVGYVVTSRDAIGQPAEMVATGPAGHGQAGNLYRLQSRGPRAWFVEEFRVVRNDTDLWRELSAAEFDPLHEALLETDVPRPAGETAACSGVVEWRERAPERLRLRTISSRPCLLVLAELDYPGWRATVDGAPSPIYRANGILRSMVVPGGEHVVSMDFRPASVLAGLFVSAATIIAMLVAAVLLLHQRRRRSSGR